jgi:hypothetical protein
MADTDIKTQENDKFESMTHRIGRFTLAFGFIISLLPPLLLWLIYGYLPPWQNLLQGILNVSIIMLPVSIVEILTFSPMMGSGAMYLSYMTGNISNLKIPSAAISMDAVDVKKATRQGDVTALIAIAGSVIGSEIVLILAVILIVPITPQLSNPVLKPAFENILPALFGALGAFYFMKEWKLAVAPLITAVILSWIGKIPSTFTIPICVLVSILAARFLYKKNLIGE